MTSSALLMGFAGLILTFFPDELAGILNMEDNRISILFLQMMGAMYFAFGMLNWMSKGSRIGGIYNRPIAIANMTHFLMVGITMAKLMLAGGVLPVEFWALVSVYLAYAVVFVRILFKTPKIGSSQ